MIRARLMNAYDYTSIPPGAVAGTYIHRRYELKLDDSAYPNPSNDWYNSGYDHKEILHYNGRVYYTKLEVLPCYYMEFETADEIAAALQYDAYHTLFTWRKNDDGEVEWILTNEDDYT